MSVVRRAALVVVLAASASSPVLAAAATTDCHAGTTMSADAIATRLDALAVAGRLHDEESAACIARLDALAATDPRLRNRARVAKASREFALGHVDAARAEAEKVLAVTPLDERDAIDVQLLIAEIEVTHSEHAKAQQRLDALLARPKGTLDAHDETMAATLRARAIIFQRKPDARAAAQSAREIAERHYGAKSAYASLAWLETGVAARVAADYGSAIEAIERMLSLQETLAMPNRSQQARALVMIAQTRKIAGDVKRAESDYETALAFMRDHPEPVPIHLSSALGGIANLQRDTNRVELSLASYERAVPVYRQAFGEASMQLAAALNNQGVAYGKLERYDDALRVYKEAIGIAEKLGAGDDPGMSMPRGNVALIYLWKKDYVSAEAGFRALLARTVNQALGSETDSTYSRLGVAASLWGQGRVAEAFAEAERAESERQLGLSLAMARMSETGAIGLQEIQRPSLDLMVAIAHASNDAKLIERTWESALLARGQVTQQVAARLALGRAAGDGAAADAFARWRTASAAMTELRLANLRSPTPAAKLRETEDALERAERELGAITVATAAALPRERTPMSALRAALPAGAGLVSYVEGNVREPEEYALDAAERRSRDVYAFVAIGDAPVRLVRLVDRETISRDAGRWRELAGRPDSAIEQVTAVAQRLRRAVLDPLALPTRDRRIFVVPGGELHRLNFAALANDTGGSLLEDGLQFHLLNHEQELLATPLPKPTAALHVFAVSDPAFARGTATTRSCGDEPGLPALPGTRREVESLRGLLPENAVLTALDGSAATEAAVRDALPGNDILHLATHALRVDGACGARTRSAGFAKRAPATTTEPVPGALVLATDASGGDSLLTEAEVSAIDLERVRWAVLSACDTGLGDSRYYEGAFGLRRAFLLAGARTVIMSLWRIDDAGTADWMKALYQARLRDGRDTPDAVSAAMRAMLQQRRERGLSVHPYYWAAFVASGDWR